MPNIPTFDNTVEPHLAGTPQASAAAGGAAGAGLAQAGGQVHEVMQEFNARYQEARRQADASNRLATFTPKLGDAQFRWGKTPDRAAALAGFNTEAATLRKQILADVPDELERLILQREFDSQAAMRSLDVGHDAFNLESHKRVGELEQNQLVYAQQIAATDNPALKAKLHDQAIADLHGAEAAGWLDPEDRAGREIKFNADLDEAAARRMLNDAIETQNPAVARAASAAINDPHQFTNLTPERREVLTTRIDNQMIRLENRAIAAQAHADAVAERSLHQAQNRTATLLIAGIHNGKSIDDATIEQLAYAGQLSESGLNAVYSAKRSQEQGHNVAGVVSNVWHLINTNDPTAHDAYQDALTHNQLSADTAGAMVKALDARGPSGKNVQTSMYNVLRTELNGAIYEQGRYGGDATAAHHNWEAAQAEWAQRVTVQHQDPQAVLTDLMAKYRHGARPTWLPPLLTGAKPATWDDMKAAAQALQRMRDSGELSPADFASQDALMRQYGRFLPPPPKPAPRQPAQGARP